MIQFNIITIFPKAFDSYFNESIIKRAVKKKLIKINIHNLRDVTTDKHHKVDDKPYGGGPGMILMVAPIDKTLKTLKTKNSKLKTRTIMLTPSGKTFDQKIAVRLAKYDRIVLLCGRYEGFDARVDKLVDEKISIGNYVLSGGELPAMVLTEAVARNIKGVVGHEHALDEETFSPDLDYIEYPQYTRPEKFKLQSAKGKSQIAAVPKVLLSGNHAEIAHWRKSKSKQK